MVTLTDRCLALPYRERLNLCEALKNSILVERRDRPHLEMNRGLFLLDKMSQILGEPVLERSREVRYVWARAIVVYQMMMEGFGVSETGRLIGKNHSTITYLRHRMQDVMDYPAAYRDIIDMWNKFQKLINDDIQRGTTHDLICLGGQFPDCGQRTMGQESGEHCTPDHL